MRTGRSWKIVVLMLAVCWGMGLTQLAQADTTVGDANSYIIEVDTDDLGGGAFIVNDYDGAGPTVTIINADANTTTLSSTATQVTGTLSVAGASTLNGIDNDGDGITNVGAISGATTIDASGTITGGNLATAGTLSVTDLSTLSGGITADSIHISDATSGTDNISGVVDLTATNVNATTVAAGDTSGTAGTINVTDGAANTITLNGATGAIGSTSLATTGNADVGGALAVTGTTTLTGTLTANGGATITSPNAAHSLSVTDTTTTVNGGATIFSGTGTGNSMVVGSTAVTTTAGNNSIDVNDATNTITLIADNDALSTNARGALVITPDTIVMATLTDAGNARGLVINPTETVLSGGTGTSSMTLDDDGATFADVDTGAPITVTGVANASSDFDAVNYKQFKNLRERAYSGIASVAALAAIPSPMPGKNYSIGTGFGNYAGESAVALGGKAHLGSNVSVAAGFGYTGDDFTTNVGLGLSW